MPDHLHLLVKQILSHRTLEKVRWGVGSEAYLNHPQSTLSRVRVKEEFAISDLMQSIKGNFSRQIHIGNIWQPRFNTRIVDTEERLINPAPSSGVLDPSGRIYSTPLHPHSKLWGIRGRCRINTIEYIKNNPEKTGLPEIYSRFPYMYFDRKAIDELF